MMSSEPDSRGLVSRTVSWRFQAEKKLVPKGDTFEVECVSTLPGIPYAPQRTTEVVQFKIIQPPQIINNQKLHWQTSTSGASGVEDVSKFQQIFLMLLLTTVRWLFCLDFDTFEEDGRY